jgi:hypothetical protein
MQIADDASNDADVPFRIVLYTGTRICTGAILDTKPVGTQMNRILRTLGIC